MEDSIKEQFVKRYTEDKKYKAIVEDIKRAPTSEDPGYLFCVGYPFVIINNLLYNIRPDGTRALCIPHAMITTILKLIHDEKHHFGVERMIYDLRGITLHNKTHFVK